LCYKALYYDTETGGVFPEAKGKNMSTFLGIEHGSTRIKAVLIDENFKPRVAGSRDWENRLVDDV
jgi:activator of 2-hydroxyglutaryl-CoA dehydratase